MFFCCQYSDAESLVSVQKGSQTVLPFQKCFVYMPKFKRAGKTSFAETRCVALVNAGSAPNEIREWAFDFPCTLSCFTF